MKNYISKYKTDNTLQKRSHESAVIKKKYPNRIPIIVESNSENLPKIENTKLLVPDNITIAQFMFIIRKRVKLNDKQAIFLFINNTLPTNTSILKDVYETNKDEDGFLYIVYKFENTFG